MTAADVAALLDGACSSGTGFTARCPAHDDKTASLSIGTGQDGRVLLKCHAGCQPEDVVHALGLTWKDVMGEAAAAEGASERPAKTRNGPARRIVATYDYFDAGGVLRFQTVRYDPKAFKQRRPDATGGWVWNLEGVPPLLYRLPEVLEAIEKGREVWVVEGEKDADALADLGFTATCNPMGAGKWKPEHTAYLEGAEAVYILPDADKPGVRHALAVADSLNAAGIPVRLLEPFRAVGDTQGPKDVSDWLAAGGTPEVLWGRASQSPAHDGTPPGWSAAWLTEPEKGGKADATSADDGEPQEAPWQPFPLDTLPVPVADFVTAAAAAVGCDPAFVAVPALAVMAGAVGNARRVRLKQSWEEPATLWAVTIAPSGSAKSPAWEMALAPVFALEREARKAHEAAQAAYEEDRRAFDALPKQQRGQATPPTPEPRRRYRLSETTVEAIVDRHRDNERGLLVARDELAGWFASFDRYSNGGGDMQNWIDLHDGRPVVTDRKTGERQVIDVDRPSVCVVGTVQPRILQESLTPPHFDSGFAPRLILAEPPTVARQWSDADVMPDVRAAYDRQVRGLYDLPAGDALPLSAEALELFIAWVNENGALQHGLPHGPLRSSLSKTEARAARLALVFHLADAVTAGYADDPGPVTGEAMYRALRLTWWIRYEQARLYRRYRFDKRALSPSASLAAKLPERFGWEDVAEVARVERRQAFNLLTDLKGRGLIEDDGRGQYRRLASGTGSTSELPIALMHSLHFSTNPYSLVQKVHKCNGQLSATEAPRAVNGAHPPEGLEETSPLPQTKPQWGVYREENM